jgi:hypothetical protein
VLSFWTDAPKGPIRPRIRTEVRRFVRSIDTNAVGALGPRWLRSDILKTESGLCAHALMS